MTHPRSLWAALVVLVMASPVCADIAPPWGYSWSAIPLSILPSSGAGSLNLNPESSPGTNPPNPLPPGSTYLIGVGVQVVNGPDPSVNGVYNDVPYKLSLTITDKTTALPQSNSNNPFIIEGEVSGTITSNGPVPPFTNVFLNPQTQMPFLSGDSGAMTQIIGGTSYTVTPFEFLPPGPPGSQNKGGIEVEVSWAPAGNPTPAGLTPEPSSLLLCSLGAVGLAFAGWRRRRSGPSPAALSLR